jgi:class 3 adenylate cyclase
MSEKLAAILVSDVVGYSRLAGTDEGGALAQLRALRSDLIDSFISACYGRIVEFRSVVGAVRFEVRTACSIATPACRPTAASNFASASTLATSSRRATATSWATASISPRDWRASRSQAAFVFRKTDTQRDRICAPGVSLDRNSSEAFANLGMILACAGELEEAVTVTGQALRLCPTPAPGIRLSSSTTRANCERAIDEMKAVGAIWPAAVTPHEHLAAAYANLSKLDLARSEAGLIKERAMPNPSLALARLWYEPYYKRVEDLNRHGSLGRRCRRALPEAGIGISLHDHDRWVDSSSDS